MTDLPRDTNLPAKPVEAEEPKKSKSVVKSPSGDKFVRWAESQLTTPLGKVGLDQVIIKRKRVTPGATRMITSQIDFEPQPKSMKATPIEQDGKIIGLTLQCDCGATHEVNFEFDKD